MKLKKKCPLTGEIETHSEFGGGHNVVELTFHNQVVIPFDNEDGKMWFTAEVLGCLLGYADKDKVLNLYYRHKDEFTPSMTTVAKVRVCNENNELQHTQIRLFSPRGAHLIGMFARTKVAKELRVWLLDLADKEARAQSFDLTNLSFASMKEMSVKQITDFLVKAEEYSKRENGTKGSLKMHRRKKEKKAIENADRAAKQFVYFTLGLQFADGEACQ